MACVCAWIGSALTATVLKIYGVKVLVVSGNFFTTLTRLLACLLYDCCCVVVCSFKPEPLLLAVAYRRSLPMSELRNEAMLLGTLLSWASPRLLCLKPALRLMEILFAVVGLFLL